MPKKPQQIPIMQSGGRGGGGGGASLAQAAIGNFIDDQNAAQQKMMKNFSQLQEAQAMGARQDAAQMTGAMNRVVAREDERQVREEQMQERMEEKTGDRRYAEWTAKFQADAQKDLLKTQQRVGEQMAAGRDFLQRMDTNRQEFGNRIKAYRQFLHDPGNVEYWTKTTGGLEKMGEMNRRLRIAQMFHEQDHHSDYTAEAAQMMGQVHEQILAGEAHADLTQLYSLKPTEVLASSEWTLEDERELFHTGGYPPGGVYGRDPGDPALRKYQGFNPVDFMSGMWMLEDEQFFSMVQDRKLQDDYLAMRMESNAERDKAHHQIRKFDDQDYKFLESDAVEAVYAGAASVIDDLASGKFSPGTISSSLTLKSGMFAVPGMRDALATKILESTFTSVAGRGSEAFLTKMDELLKGTGDGGLLDTEVELGLAFALRNRLTHVENQLMSMTMAPKEGEPISMSMAKVIEGLPDSPDQRELLRSLAMMPGDEARGELLEPIRRGPLGGLAPETLGQIHSGVNRTFMLAMKKVRHLLDVIENQPAMVGYNMEAGALGRHRDAVMKSYFSDKPGEGPDPEDEEAYGAAQDRAMEYATDEQKREAAGEAPEGFDIETETLKEKIKLSPLTAFAELLGKHNSRPELIAAMLSGDYDNATPMFDDNKGATPDSMQRALDQYYNEYTARGEAVAAELMRRRVAAEKKAGVGQEQAGQGGPPPGDEPNAPMAGAQ